MEECHSSNITETSTTEMMHVMALPTVQVKQLSKVKSRLLQLY